MMIATIDNVLCDDGTDGYVTSTTSTSYTETVTHSTDEQSDTNNKSDVKSQASIIKRR